MIYKHQAELSQLPFCPPPDVGPPEPVAYRFIKQAESAERNFTCPAQLKPNRRFAASEQCAALALSLYQSEAQARAAFASLAATFANIRKAIGDSLARVGLVASDGMISPVDEAGHFDLWVAETTDFRDRFTILHPEL